MTLKTSKHTSLIVESHPEEYEGYPFITLIKYRHNVLLTIVDNVTEEHIKAFVIDYCGSENVNEEEFIEAVRQWHDETPRTVPISIEFSKQNIMQKFSKIYRTLNVEFVSRVIGPVCKYDMNTTLSVRRKRRKPLPIGVEIVEAA